MPSLSNSLSQKSHFLNKAVDDSPFAPPAFYDEDDEYPVHDAKWMSWTPSIHKPATDKVSDDVLKSTEKSVETQSQPDEKVEPKSESPKDVEPQKPAFGGKLNLYQSSCCFVSDSL